MEHEPAIAGTDVEDELVSAADAAEVGRGEVPRLPALNDEHVCLLNPILPESHAPAIHVFSRR
jgi:hypothetical protein